jgi:uncharacterized protein (TIGR00251 family)
MLDLQETSGGVLLRVKAVPGSARPGIRGTLGGALKVALASPPEKGKANRELLALLAAALGVPRSSLTLHAGHGSPRKTVLVTGLSPAALRAKLDSVNT